VVDHKLNTDMNFVKLVGTVITETIFMYIAQIYFWIIQRYYSTI